MPTTATMMFGVGETHEQRLHHLDVVRRAQDESLAEGAESFTSFIPWTFQPANTPLQDDPALRAAVARQGYLGAVDYLRTLAIARIALDNFANLQASWVTQGKAVGQLTLYHGANDLGSLMMEESVVSKAGTVHALERADLDEMILGAGFRPALRDNGYRLLG